MAWPISDIPLKKKIPAPKYRFWIVILILMLMIGIGSGLWIWDVKTYIKLFLYGIFPSFLIWLCLFGVVLNRYEQSVIYALTWNKEAENTKAAWRSWSRKQLAVVGNILLSPEEKGMDTLLGNLEDVPAYPKKARPLFGTTDNFQQLINDIDKKLEHQRPGYRNLLHSIYVLQAPGRFEKMSNEAIFQQWDLIPVSYHSSKPLELLYESDDFEGLILIICLQDWPNRKAAQSSEFISAQLITSASLAQQLALPAVAGITRMMPLEKGKLIDELDMFFEYNQPDKQDLEYVWLTGAAENTAADIMYYATQHEWVLPEKRPLHSIDLSFGPPGEMILPLSLAMLVEAANKTAKDQLLISQTPQQTGTLCLITRKLYS